MDHPENFDLPALRSRLMALLGEAGRYYPNAIEQQFPHILARIVEHWGKPELDAYLGELMLPERPGRRGFPQEIAMEIFHISSVHSSLTVTTAKSTAGWAGIDDPEYFRKALRKDGK